MYVNIIISKNNKIIRYTFVEVTKGVLGKANIPIFSSIGNHDYQISNLSTQAFENYIGPVRESFVIPRTKVKLIRINSHFTGLQNGKIHEGYFSPDDLKLLPHSNMDYHYLINFHVPLRVCAYKNISDKIYIMSENQTKSLLNNLNPKVSGIFTHHKHSRYRCNINYEYNNKHSDLPFFISDCSGNYMCKSPYFFYITLNLKTYNLNFKIYQI